jgi:hypothetical protein
MPVRVLSCAAAVGVALLLVLLEPIGEPWWINADPDGAYVASSLNILIGNHTDYLDHPGLPTQDALALGFGAEYLFDKAAGNVTGRQQFVDRQFLDLDRARPLYRGWTIALFIGGAVAVYWALTLFLRSAVLGFAGSLLYVGTPGIAQLVLSLRPDPILTALSVVVSVLIADAFERRNAVHYFFAAAVLGLALMMKLPAIALGVPLALAALWHPPADGWARPLGNQTRRSLRRHVFWIAPLAVAWIVLCVVFNRERLPILTNNPQRHVLENGGAAVGGVVVAAFVAERFRLSGARRLFSTFTALLVLAFVAGLALPATLILDDGIQSIAAMWDSLTGGRVNAGIKWFADFRLVSLVQSPLRYFTLVFVLAVAAAFVGAIRRIWWPALLALGASLLAVSAAARYSFPYYYGPAFGASIPGALWLFARRRLPLQLVGCALGVVVAVAAFQHRQESTREVETVNADAQRLADRLVKPGEVVVAAAPLPIADLRFDQLVAGFADYTPPTYPYRFLVVGSARLAESHLTPAYYVAPVDSIDQLSASSRLDVNGATYGLKALPIRWGPRREFGVAALVRR